MDFKDTPEEAAFRAEARAFLEANAAPRDETKQVNYRGHISDEEVQRAKLWQAKKAEAGFAAIGWPKKWGGRDAAAIMSVIYHQEELKFDVPVGVFEVGVGMCLPTMLSYATEEQLKTYIPPALRGEHIWCQLFSEPGAGSDLAGIRTRAVRDGDEWVINGQKIWNSGAHHSDFGILVTRSDPTVPKHKGMTFFFVDMKTPGVEVRPIHQITGAHRFSEVFLTDVRIHDSQRLGKVGDGWRVSLTTLMNERVVGGTVDAWPNPRDLYNLSRMVESGGEPAIKNPAVREKLADWYAQSQGLKIGLFRTLTAVSKGKEPGPENSIGKLVKAKMSQDIASYGLDLLDAGGIVFDQALSPLNMMFQEGYLSSPGGRIAGGTDEILRNIIAERVLGMPGDFRLDKDVPFDKIPRG
jgi:alkylation response protein AidB-like acyl-CoA dehydrogenase